MQSRRSQWLMAGHERLLWPVKARPGDNWLDFVGTDGAAVNVAVGIGLGNLELGLSKNDRIPGHLGLEHVPDPKHPFGWETSIWISSYHRRLEG